MERIVVPIRRRRRQWQWSEPVSDLLCNAILAISCGVAWLVVVFTSGKNREKALEFRRNTRVIWGAGDATVRQTDARYGKNTTVPVDGYIRKYGDTEDAAEWAETSKRVHAMMQDVEAMVKIIRDSGEDNALATHRLRGFIADNPDNHIAISFLAGVLWKAGDRAGSLSAHREAIRLAGEHSVIGASSRLHLGNALQEMGDMDAAIAQYRSLITDDLLESAWVVVSQAYLCLGNALEMSGDNTNARIAWKQAIKWDITDLVAKQAREKLQARR